MKKILFGAVALLIFSFSANAQIVNNSGSTAADSISLPFKLLDSLGIHVLNLAASDTIFVTVFYPSGAIAWEDSIPQGNSRIVADSQSNDVGQYALKLAIADIDGSGKDGVYSYQIIADDESKDIETYTYGRFQLYQAKDYNTWATFVNDSLQAVIDSLQLLDEKYTSLRDSINLVHAEIDTELDNIVEAFDDDGTLVDLELSQLRVIAPTSQDTAVKFVGVESGMGLFITAAGDAFRSVSTSNRGMSIIGEAGGLLVQSNGTGSFGAKVLNFGTGHSVEFDAVSGGSALSLDGDMGIEFGVTGDPIEFISDTLQGIIDTLQNQDNWIAQQAEVLNIDAWNPITDNDSLIIDRSALNFLAGGTDSVQIDESTLGTLTGTTVPTVTTVATVTDLADSAINEAAIMANTIVNTKIASGAIGSDEIAGSAADEIGLATWNTSATTSFTAGSMGDSAIGAANGWGATAASSFNPSTDSVLVKGSAFNAALIVVDTVGKLRDSAIAPASMMSNTITANKIASSAITGAKTTFTAGGADSVQIDESTLGTLTGTTIPTVTTVTNQVTANVTAIAGDATADDSLANLLNGNGSSLFVGDLQVLSSTMNDVNIQSLNVDSLGTDLFNIGRFHADKMNLDSIGADTVAGWSGGLADSVYVKGGFVDSNKTEQGGIAGANLGFLVYVIDTSGTDDTLSQVGMTLQNATGVTKGSGFTLSGGGTQFTVTSGDWAVLADKNGYVIPESTYTVSANDTVAILGYNIAVGTPASASLTRVYGYVKSIQDVALDGVNVIATLNTGKNQTDSTGEAVIITDIIGSAPTDTIGYFFLDLRKTGSYADTTRGFYDIRGYYGSKQIFEVTKVRVYGTTLNLGDILASRK